MNSPQDRRRWYREVLQIPEVGFLYTEFMEHEPESALKGPINSFFVDICDKSRGGVLIKSGKKIESNDLLNLKIYNSFEKLWKYCKGNVKWIKIDPSNPDCYQIGLEIQELDPKIITVENEAKGGKQTPLPTDYEFFSQTRLLRFIPRDAVCPLLNSLTYKRLMAGERLMSQGEVGDALYIIQSGSCVANVKKNGELHPVARLREGDIVGEMAIVTGELRNANVDAETDMELWCLTRSQFDDISKEYPELRSFLTELVANRFETSKVTAHRTINKYLIQDIIGRGGYSIVYKGVHVDLNMPVAIKMMRHDMAMNPDFLKSFWNEAKVIAGFNHDNIIRVYDVEKLYRTFFIIMEYTEGEPLNAILKRLATIPLPQTVDFLSQICEGLSYAHKREIIHQDIKLANLFIQRGGRLKILDFGLACPIGTEEQLFEGTVYYTAPEQIECDAVDQRTDIYSLGISAYEMVTGKRPYPEDDLMALRKMRVKQDIPDPARIVSDLPKILREFILTACRRDPDQRYQDMGQAIEVLKPLVKKFSRPRKDLSLGKKKMTTLFLIYKDDHQLALNQIIEELDTKIQMPGIIHKTTDFPLEEQRMTTLLLIYKNDHQLVVNQILEEFSDKVKELGIVQKAADFQVA